MVVLTPVWSTVMINYQCVRGTQHSAGDGKCRRLRQHQSPARNLWMLPLKSCLYRCDSIKDSGGTGVQGIALGHLCGSYVQPPAPYKRYRSLTTGKKEGHVTQRKPREASRKPKKQILPRSL